MVRTKSPHSSKKSSGRSFKNRSVTLDFTDVEVGARRKIPNDRDYLFIVKDVEEGEGDAGVYWTVIAVVKEGKYAGFKDWLRLSLSKKAMWKIAQFLEAVGLEATGKKVKVKPKDLIDREFGASVDNEEYKGKVTSRIADFFPAADLEDTDDSDDEEEDDTEEDGDELDEEEDDEENEE